MKTLQLKFFFLMLLLAAAAPLFAQDLSTLGLGGLESFGNTILNIFTGTLVRIILTCCLAGCGIAYGFNKDNEKMKRNVIAIGIGIMIIAAASGIVQAVFTASGRS
jgi:type IV secretory pathway VirB2 component (pilin)